MPTVDETMDLYQLLLEAGSQLRQPVALEEQLLALDKGLSSDVGKSMLQLLQVKSCHHHCDSCAAAAAGNVLSP